MTSGELNVTVQRSKTETQTRLVDAEQSVELLAYPIDMSSFLRLPSCTFDAAGVPCHGSSSAYPPTTIAQYALAHWNQYLATNDEHHRRVFLVQAYWFVEHVIKIGEDAGGWPIVLPRLDVPMGNSALSALTQGSALSVLVQAYRLTSEEVFLRVAHRAARTFERDILDGGVNTPIGADGLFFEEVAVYPAAHTLSGFIFSLFGLYDYVSLTRDAQIERLIARSLETMRSLLEEFDTGFWTRADLLHRHLASPAHLTLQIMLLEALASYSGNDHYMATARRWKSYQRRILSRLRYLMSSSSTSLISTLGNRLRTMIFPKSSPSSSIRVCVPINAFPVTGGTQTVLRGVAQVTADVWQLEYLTRFGDSHAEHCCIHRFGTVKMSPWHFPTVWLYVLAGCWKLLTLIRQGANYKIILPQDGVFTAAFSALVAKLAGIRVVCIDHSTLTWLTRRVYRVYHAERVDALAKKHWPVAVRFLVRLLFELYWPSLHLLARISSRLVDHFLAPGIVSDDLQEVCHRLRIGEHRITRFASLINVDRYTVHDAASKASIRERYALAPDAIVITMICRLAPEKGIDVALESISHALSALDPELSTRVSIIIAGGGPLRKQVEQAIHAHGLDKKCSLWGDIAAEAAITLLGLSDIFLYTSIRGAYFSMAILEAMASGCAIVASTEPISNEHLLAGGRGIAVPPSNVAHTSQALVRLINEPALRQQMGQLARNYVAEHHNAVLFRRALMRATYWSNLDQILGNN
jgi:glycosyltransferase involved in cell wall biosynthesis